MFNPMAFLMQESKEKNEDKEKAKIARAEAEKCKTDLRNFVQLGVSNTSQAQHNQHSVNVEAHMKKCRAFEEKSERLEHIAAPGMRR